MLLKRLGKGSKRAGEEALVKSRGRAKGAEKSEKEAQKECP
jgi:hypothetical protein